MKKMVRRKGRAKRFDEGGPTEDQLKAEGLKASQGEDVGFFRRLAMGNIDDPSSEAYAQFGAGRGRAERARQAPQPAPQAPQPAMNPVAANAPVPQASQWNTPWGASSFPVPQNAPRMVEQEEEGPVRPQKRVRQEAPRKASMDTGMRRAKEDIESSRRASMDTGIAQARRGIAEQESKAERKPAKEKPAKEESSRFGMGPKNTFLTEERTKAAADAYDRGWGDSEEKPAKKTPAKTAPVERSKDEEAYALARKPSAKALESWKEDEYAGMTPAEKSIARGKKLRQMFGLKSGGSVSSGYRKGADGITSRGKTKGRFV
jgi:hypothetical protein